MIRNLLMDYWNEEFMEILKDNRYISSYVYWPKYWCKVKVINDLPCMFCSSYIWENALLLEGNQRGIGVLAKEVYLTTKNYVEESVHLIHFVLVRTLWEVLIEKKKVDM